MTFTTPPLLTVKVPARPADAVGSPTFKDPPTCQTEPVPVTVTLGREKRFVMNASPTLFSVPPFSILRLAAGEKTGMAPTKVISFTVALAPLTVMWPVTKRFCVAVNVAPFKTLSVPVTSTPRLPDARPPTSNEAPAPLIVSVVPESTVRSPPMLLAPVSVSEPLDSLSEPAPVMGPENVVLGFPLVPPMRRDVVGTLLPMTTAPSPASELIRAAMPLPISRVPPLLTATFVAVGSAPFDAATRVPAVMVVPPV